MSNKKTAKETEAGFMRMAKAFVKGNPKPKAKKKAPKK
jgi:hypothetical protein